MRSPWHYPHLMSPVSGKVNIGGTQTLQFNYTWVGNNKDVAQPSPAIIDLRLDLIALKKNLNNTPFIIKTKTIGYEDSQALDDVDNGMISNLDGLIVPTSLTHNKFWLGDVDDRPIESDSIPIEILPPLHAQTISIGPVSYGIREMIQGTNSGQAEISYSVYISLSQIDFAFRSTPWILGKKMPILGTINYPAAQYISDLLNNRILMHSTDGTIIEFSLQENYLLIGGANSVPGERLTIQFLNLPDLTNKRIIRGNEQNRPIESDDLTNAENKISQIEQEITEINTEITGIQGDIALINTAIEGINAAIFGIETQIGLINGALAALQAQIAGIITQLGLLQGQINDLRTDVDNLRTDVTNLQTRVTNLETQIADIIEIINGLTVTLVGDVTGTGGLDEPIVTELQLTLDEIKKAQDSVDLNNQQIIDLKCESVQEKEAINAQFFWDFLHNNIGITWP